MNATGELGTVQVGFLHVNENSAHDDAIRL